MRRGEHHPHARTLLLAARFDRQRSAMTVDDFPDDRETETGAFARGTRRSVEALDDLVPFLWGNPGAGVLNPQRRTFIVETRADRNSAADRGVVERVVDQVVDELG